MLEKSYIHHLKALMCGINASRGQGHGCRFTMCHASLKMALLLHKVGLVSRLMSTTVQLNLALRTFSVRAILVLKVKNVLILTVIYYINHQLVIGDLVLKVKQVLILTVLKAKFDCTNTY